MQRLSRWVSAGLLTAGVSAGVLTGAGVASAETGSSPPPGSGASGTSEPGATKTGSPADTKAGEPGTLTGTPATSTSQPDPPKKKKKKPAASGATQSAAHKAEVADTAEASTNGKTVTTEPTARTAQTAAAPVAKAAALRLAQEPATATAAPTAVNPVKVIAKAVTTVFNAVGSVAINALQALEKLFTGPPALPANSTVTVRTSSILLGNGQRVQANWYYPDDDEPPDQMILLQHGFFALGPMYSYTAANLAERTHSVVVTPTLPSNWFAGDDHWLGGTGMAAEIADLFDGNRAALTQSAIAAGYAIRYDLDPTTAALPQKFALAGHSLGANLVSGVAGFLADSGAAKDLVGVILLDGVPNDGTLEDALTKLDTFQANGGHYIPVREIGAPANLFNSISTVNAALSTARPGQFNGVVLSGGVHMDSMQGGNPVIQFAAFLVAGFPQKQNPPAVQQLSVDWLRAWFDGTDEGPVPMPGSVIDIDTPKGTAHGRVI